MTIIVTGGAGFIGGNFIHYMLREHPGYRIVCLDSLTYAGNLATLDPVKDHPDFRFCQVDITERGDVYKIFMEEKPDIVVNFAAESHVDRSIEEPTVFLQTNILGTATMMDACRRYGIKRYHQVSTMRCTAIFPWIVPTCSSRRRRLYTPPAPTPHPRPPQICCAWRMRVPTGSLSPYPAAPTTTGPITSPRSSYLL